LKEKGIDTGLHYPTALPFLETYAERGYQPSDFPVAHEQMGNLLSLPMFAELTNDQIDYVCTELKSAISGESSVAA
jgi:dTDP-4-amino-4,6-dideoxygalactose transaminase